MGVRRIFPGGANRGVCNFIYRKEFIKIGGCLTHLSLGRFIERSGFQPGVSTPTGVVNHFEGSRVYIFMHSSITFNLHRDSPERSLLSATEATRRSHDNVAVGVLPWRAGLRH